MLQAARPPLARLAAIDHAVRAGHYPNATTLARQFEVSHLHCVQRDLTFLRDQLRAPLAFDPQRNGYHYNRPDYNLSFCRIAEGELIALFLAERVLHQCQGTSFEADLQASGLAKRLAAMLPDQVSVDLGSLADTLSVTPTAQIIQDAALFAVVAAATTARRQLQLDYWTASRNIDSQRVVDPIHLTLIDGSWFLIAWCHVRRGLRMFAVQRVRAARETGKTFDRPADFRIEDFLRGSFRAMRGDGEICHHIVLRFSPKIAARVAERIWHRSQATEMCSDGSLLLRMELTDLREVLRWVLSWGGDCTVVEPKELRELVMQEVQSMLKE